MAVCPGVADSLADAKEIIVTAATNGSIVVWNLNKSSAQKIDRIITEHSRAVNRVTFHPSEGWVLLSASQDGSMKLW
jgi:WD40 repeat protein